MASPVSTEAQRLIRAYLDPARTWNAASAAALRAALEGDEAARAAYDRAVSLHRLMTTGDPGQPSGFEQRRRMDALIEAATAEAPGRGWSTARAALMAASGLALVLLLVQTTLSGLAPHPDDDLRVRGAQAAQPLAGLGVSGVTESGSEFEVVASGETPQAAWLRFYVSNRSTALHHVFIVGLQERAQPIWYAPLPPEETHSLPMATGEHQKLPMENRVATRHVAGPLRIIALFTHDALTTEHVARALDPRLSLLASWELEPVLRAALGLADGDVVQILETRVVAGDIKEGTVHGP